MSEENPGRIRNCDLARHAGVSPQYIGRLKKPVDQGGKDMPNFDCLSDFDAWRFAWAPARATNLWKAVIPLDDSKKNGVEGGKNIAGLYATTINETDGAEATIGEGLAANNVPGGGNAIDVTQFIAPNVDFDALMIRHAEGVPQVAHGLYLLACDKGNPNEIAAALKNWSAAAEASAAIYAKFLALKEETGALISLDLVMDVVGMELQAARAALLKLGERSAMSANPQDPALAKMVIDASVDAIFQKLFAADEVLPADLAARAPAS